MPSYFLILFVCLLAIAGCEAQPVVGGTAGVLRVDGQPLSEVQVTVHALDQQTWQPIGFGDARGDGSFELVTLGAAGPLKLPPGDYRFTLESIGAPVRIPPHYTSTESTPLRATWSGEDAQLNLELSLRPAGR